MHPPMTAGPISQIKIEWPGGLVGRGDSNLPELRGAANGFTGSWEDMDGGLEIASGNRRH